MARLTMDKIMEVIDMHIKGMAREKIASDTELSAQDVDKIVNEFMNASKRLYELAQKEDKPLQQIVDEIEDVADKHEKLLNELTYMETMD